MSSKESLRMPIDIIRQEMSNEQIEEISIIQEEIADGLESLNDREPPRNAEETLEAITLEAQTVQMAKMWQIISTMSRYGDDGEKFYVDDSPLLFGINFVRSGYFPLREDYVVEAVKAGEIKGRHLLLALLTPPYVVDQSNRETYFSPWRRDLAGRRLGLVEQEDGSAVASLPTCLYNIEVSLEYPADSLYPKRTICRVE